MIVYAYDYEIWVSMPVYLWYLLVSLPPGTPGLTVGGWLVVPAAVVTVVVGEEMVVVLPAPPFDLISTSAHA